MIRDLKPYPAYKESGLPWLGAIPEGWEVRRNGRLFAQRNETGREELPILEVSLRTGVRVRTFATSGRKQVMADPQKYKRAAKGDLAYNMMRMWQGALGMSPVEGLVSPAYVVARPLSGVETRYYTYLFRTDAYLNEVDKFSRGIVKDRNRLYWEDFKCIPSVFPPHEEQAAIVHFIDFADRLIRKAIRSKQNQIKLLHEQQQVIIQRNITRGLDPNVRLKPSGISWLGIVPEHWDISQTRRLIKPGTSITYGIVQAGPDIDGGVPYIRTSDMKRTGFAESGYLRTSLQIDQSYSRSKVSTNDLVVGIRASLGRALLVPKFLDGANLTQGTAKISPGSKLRPRFLFHAFNSWYCQENIRHIAKGTTFLEITLDGLRRIVIAVPPLGEQDEIVDFIDREIARIDSVLMKLSEEISLLGDYRLRIVSDVVTGRLDVREAAAHLPADESSIGSSDDFETFLEEGDSQEDVAPEGVEL